MRQTRLFACVLLQLGLPISFFAQNPFPIDSNSGKILYRQSFHYPEQPSDTLFKYCYDCFVDLFFWGLEGNIQHSNTPLSNKKFIVDTTNNQFEFRHGFANSEDSIGLVAWLRVIIVGDRIAITTTDFQYYHHRDREKSHQWIEFDKVYKQPLERRLKNEDSFQKYRFVDSLSREYIRKLSNCIRNRVPAVADE